MNNRMLIKLTYAQAWEFYDKGYTVHRGRSKNAAYLKRSQLRKSWDVLRLEGYFANEMPFYFDTQELPRQYVYDIRDWS